jgi:hypothetical protein
MNCMCRNIRIAICALCVFSFLHPAAAQTTNKAAIDFSNKMSAMIFTLYNDGTEWGVQFSKIDSTDRNYSRLAPIRIKMEKFLEEKLAELKKTQDVSGSHNFRMAMIHFMELDKTVLNSGLKGIEKLNTHSSDAQIKNAVKNLTEQSKKEDAELKKIIALQTAYAHQNGFTITN